MRTSSQTFLIELYEEYLEEASFLYEQRLTLLNNPEITWKQIADFEDRFEAHIDGLVVGKDLALEVCSRQAKAGDFGEAHAAVRVFCRQNRKDLFLKLVEVLDAEDVTRVQAIAEALKYELPESWHSEIKSFLRNPDPNLVLIASEAIGHQRLKAGKELTRILEEAPSTVVARAIWALGRVGELQAGPLIFSHLLDGEEPVRSAAALALLRLQNEDALHYCLQRSRSERWAILPLVLGGSRDALELLLGEAATGNASSECLQGLGILGYASAIPVLINYLRNEETVQVAANSLDRITGADLRETVFIPEELDEDELFEEEREKLKRAVPTRGDGKPFGNTVKRVSQKAEEWQRWWDHHRTSMDPLTRYRNGTPYSPACLIADLEQETTLHHARRLTYEELVVRYGLDIPFEADMFVVHQKKALVRATEWARQQGTRIVGGRSYFAGRLMSN